MHVFKYRIFTVLNQSQVKYIFSLRKVRVHPQCSVQFISINESSKDYICAMMSIIFILSVLHEHLFIPSLPLLLYFNSYACISARVCEYINRKPICIFVIEKRKQEISSPLFWIHGIVIRVKNKNWQHTHEILLSPFDLEHWHKCQKQEQNKGNNQNVRRGTMNALNWYKIQTAPTSTACHQIHNISMDKVKVEEC